MHKIKNMIMVVMSALLLFTAVPASAHIPHQEYDNYEYHECAAPHNGPVVLERVRAIVQVRTNVTGYHDVGFSGFAAGYYANISGSVYTYLSAYNYKTVYMPWRNVNQQTNYGSGISAHGQAWINYISSLEHGNVYVELIGFSCDWDWPTA